MSLYDDFDKHRTSDKVAGWSSGIKLLQSQLQLKKAATTQPKREQYRRSANVLAPVIDLKSKSLEKDKNEDANKPNNTCNLGIADEFDWNVINEYDPMWPNEYEKVVKELREIRDREHEYESEQRKRRRDMRFEEMQMSTANTMTVPDREEERTARNMTGGAAIAPPPSLQESSEVSLPSPKQTMSAGYTTSSVAAKIMAKYGFKEGQGLGKKEQGMSVALQVEKTSKRGGRIVGEREQVAVMPNSLNQSDAALLPPPPPPPPQSQQQQVQDEPTITEIMKSPSKVVLLRNMVGPGEVDDDLEPEVKDECNVKYGDVARVVIHEIPDVPAEEAVRIFVEFKRIESAIKAVVDLNGRFFGGRQVKAGFYLVEKFDSYQLMD